MKMLVTGANGHLGFNLVAALVVRRGVGVRASVRGCADPSKTWPLRALDGVELVELDVRNAEQFDAALTGIDTMFHVAENYTVFTQNPDQRREIIRDSVEGVEAALRSAAKAGVRRMVLTSSVVTLSLTKPGEARVTEEHWVDDSEVPYVN